MKLFNEKKNTRKVFRAFLTYDEPIFDIFIVALNNKFGAVVDFLLIETSCEIIEHGIK